MEDTFERRRNQMMHQQSKRKLAEDLSQKKLPGIKMPTCAPPHKPNMVKTYWELKRGYDKIDIGGTTNRPTIGRPNLDIYKKG